VVGRPLNKHGGIGMVEVPYRTTAPFAAVEGFARAGKVRRIALSSARRFPSLDDLPTIAETLPGFELDGWLVVVAPAGTPADIVTQLNRHIGQFLRHPDIQQRLAVLGLAISGTDTAETTAQFIRQQQASWRALAQELDLRPE